MKYDFRLDMDNPNSLSIILKQIMPESTILEFGPAMGRMTKYMKEVLHCQVYIIEMDEEGYQSAMQYAEGGYLGNAETGLWVSAFENLKFDYIIFADVIEHLKNPEEVITNARNLLKYEGKIIISVPNVANNAIIIDLINNKFNYKDIGLLDNTHIKFFTYYTFLDVLARCNLIAIGENATYAQPYETEFLNNYNLISDQLADALKNKEFGNVYQFIFTCIKKEDFIVNAENIISSKNIKERIPLDEFKVYINQGSELNENNIICKPIFMGDNYIELDISDFVIKDIIRLDFSEDSCIVRIDSIILDEIKFDNCTLTGNFNHCFSNYYLFLNKDPNILLKNINGNYKFISIKFHIEKIYPNLLQEEYTDLIHNNLVEMSLKNNELVNLQSENSIKSEKIIAQRRELERKMLDLESIKKLLNDKEIEYNQIKDELLNINQLMLQKESLYERLKQENISLKTSFIKKMRAHLFKK